MLTHVALSLLTLIPFGPFGQAVEPLAAGSVAEPEIGSPHWLPPAGDEATSSSPSRDEGSTTDFASGFAQDGGTERESDQRAGGGKDPKPSSNPPVPEPTTLAIVGGGLLMLSLLRRKREEEEEAV